MNINQSRYAQQSSYNANSSAYGSKLSNPVSSPAPYELSTNEAENIYQFSELLERIQQSGGDLMRDRQVQVDIIIFEQNLYFIIREHIKK